MKHFDRVLTDKLLQDIRMDVSEAHNEEAWKGSFAWPTELTKGYFSNCLSRTIVGEMKERILKEIQLFLPECKVYYLQYYIWQQLSGIAVHDDHDKVFGGVY